MYATDLQAVVGSNETIIWQGKPDKNVLFLTNDLRPEENHGYKTKYTKTDDFRF